MSNKPAPVALTAAMLMERAYENGGNALPMYIAQLASAIHRLAPACRRLAEAECDDEWREWRDGQRQWAYEIPECAADLDKSIAAYATRVDRRIAKLNAELKPFSYRLVRLGDPREHTLVMMDVNNHAHQHNIG